jgi:hypothetical protein
MLKIIRSKETSQAAMVTGSKKISGDNLNNVKREASKHFRNKRREYLKDRINELATNSKNKNIRNLYRGINKFKRGYQTRRNSVKDKNGDLLAESNNTSTW